MSMKLLFHAKGNTIYSIKILDIYYILCRCIEGIRIPRDIKKSDGMDA